MAIVTKQELLKIAQISNIRLFDDEVEGLLKQVGDLLSYAERVQEIASKASVTEVISTQQNVMRPDVIQKTDPEKFIALSCQAEEHYFVVPKILDTK